jgi:hypothetical protein
MHCPLLCADSFRKNLEDIKRMSQLLAVGGGHLLDNQGIDWWTLKSLDILTKGSEILVFRRMATEIPRSASLWSTRPGWPAAAFARILGLRLRAYGESLVARSVSRARHYSRIPRHFSLAQMKEIFLDKYDSSYQWRSRFASRKKPESEPVVLIPSAYTNVSRVASAYARLLPHKPFLLVATRRSAILFDPTPNVHLRSLGSYAGTRSPSEELCQILKNWEKLTVELQRGPELEMLLQLGVFDTFPDAFAEGLAVRDAWRLVLEREPIGAVLCGDDSNINTRLPVLLAAMRGLPTIDFHHGAMDGYYLVKQLPCDLYLAKSELERDYLLRVCGLRAEKVTVAAPLPLPLPSVPFRPRNEADLSQKNSVVFFSEPYENIGMRTEEVYREILPALCALARENGRGVVLKLHPFESVSERSGILQSILAAEDRRRITVESGPLSDNLLLHTWVGVTVESTTVMDCALRRIPCFLCGWLGSSLFGYLQQYTKFGAGQVLSSVEDVATIPHRIAGSGSSARDPGLLWRVVDPELLSKWLGGESFEPIAVRHKGDPLHA